MLGRLCFWISKHSMIMTLDLCLAWLCPLLWDRSVPCLCAWLLRNLSGQHSTQGRRGQEIWTQLGVYHLEMSLNPVPRDCSSLSCDERRVLSKHWSHFTKNVKHWCTSHNALGHLCSPWERERARWCDTMRNPAHLWWCWVRRAASAARALWSNGCQR